MSGRTTPSASTSSIPSIRATKVGNVRFYSFCFSHYTVSQRKLEDAIQSLDAAVSSMPPFSSTEITPLSKRPHLSRSFYSTLAKYGVKSREDPEPSEATNIIDMSMRAPHLAAILARHSPQNTKTVPFKCPSAPPASSEYRPSSTRSFLSRLATYKLSTYANKPPQIDAVAAAKCGWMNDGKDRLVCGVCGISWVLATREGMTRDAANALIEKQRTSLVQMHKDGCPWKTRQCDASIYRVPLQSPSTTARGLSATAMSLEPIVANIAIKHPLTPSQLNSICSAVSTISSPSLAPEDPSAMQVDESTPPPASQVSDTSLIAALFGWVPAPSPPLHERRRMSSLSASHIGSFGPSASMPPTPTFSRASSVSRALKERESTPMTTLAPGPSASSRIGPSISHGQLSASPPRPRVSFHVSGAFENSISCTGAAKDMSLVHCLLCQRRVGLWSFATVASQQEEGEMIPVPADSIFASAFVSAEKMTATSQPRKPFDLLKEHRSYCPYVVRSTTVPSASALNTTGSPESSGSLLEGWRAVLATLQRHGLSQRQRLARFVPNGEGSTGTRDEELEGVEAMVAGVKSKGVRASFSFRLGRVADTSFFYQGREVLRYVRGLLA
ncbi:C3HC zinc finger-like-domain-containing protein [Scleroderma yunnanense]